VQIQQRHQQLLIFATSLILTASIFVYFFYQAKPEGGLAFDRRILHEGVRTWDYGRGMSNPPWSIMLIYPFENLPLQLGWGLLAFLLFTALIAWIPAYRGWTRYLLLIGLPLSYLTLRNYAEGNYEAFVLWGLFCLFYGYQKQIPLLLAFGVLLATIKLQNCIILVALLPWYIRHWDRQKQRDFYSIMAAVLLPVLLLWGKTWLDSLGYFANRGTSIVILDLPAPLTTLARVSIIVVAVWFSLDLNRLSIGLLVVASLLIAPYTGELSAVVVLAICITAIFAQGHTWLGLLFFVLYQDLRLPIFLDFEFEAYWFVIFLLTYGVLVWENYQHSPAHSNATALDAQSRHAAASSP
jgi:hypothetical protein